MMDATPTDLSVTRACIINRRRAETMVRLWKAPSPCSASPVGRAAFSKEAKRCGEVRVGAGFGAFNGRRGAPSSFASQIFWEETPRRRRRPRPGPIQRPLRLLGRGVAAIEATPTQRPGASTPRRSSARPVLLSPRKSSKSSSPSSVVCVVVAFGATAVPPSDASSSGATASATFNSSALSRLRRRPARRGDVDRPLRAFWCRCGSAPAPADGSGEVGTGVGPTSSDRVVDLLSHERRRDVRLVISVVMGYVVASPSTRSITPAYHVSPASNRASTRAPTAKRGACTGSSGASDGVARAMTTDPSMLASDGDGAATGSGASVCGDGARRTRLRRACRRASASRRSLTTAGSGGLRQAETLRHVRCRAGSDSVAPAMTTAGSSPRGPAAGSGSAACSPAPEAPQCRARPLCSPCPRRA